MPLYHTVPLFLRNHAASSFFFAQFCTSIFWGFMSDRYGRRPILLLGLCGSTVACIFFGLSKSLAWAITSRSMCGLLNGIASAALFRELVRSTIRYHGVKSLNPNILTLRPCFLQETWVWPSQCSARLRTTRISRRHSVSLALLGASEWCVSLNEKPPGLDPCILVCTSNLKFQHS